MKTPIVITSTEIASTVQSTGALWRKINLNHLVRARAIHTPKRRRAAFVAVARDAVAAVLMERHSLTRFQQLTAAIRAGAAPEAADFTAINEAACAVLFPNEVTA